MSLWNHFLQNLTQVLFPGIMAQPFNTSLSSDVTLEPITAKANLSIVPGILAQDVNTSVFSDVNLETITSQSNPIIVSKYSGRTCPQVCPLLPLWHLNCFRSVYCTTVHDILQQSNTPPTCPPPHRPPQYPYSFQQYSDYEGEFCLSILKHYMYIVELFQHKCSLPRLSNDIAQIYVLAYFAEYNYDDGGCTTALHLLHQVWQRFNSATSCDRLFPSIGWWCI